MCDSACLCACMRVWGGQWVGLCVVFENVVEGTD